MLTAQQKPPGWLKMFEYAAEQLEPAAAEPLEADPRRSLIAFTQHTYPSYTVDPFHRLVADTLDKVVAGEIERLMIMAPPQFGKSELVSIRLPAYWFGKHPNWPLLLCSYGADYAEKKSREVRDVVRSNEYRDLFPNIRLRGDSQAVGEWGLDGYKGYLKAAGVGGPITGRGAMLGIVDDPYKNLEEAKSPTIREKVRDWWKSTFLTRIWPGGRIVLIMTRWVEDDLAGSLLEEQADLWTVLRLPALAETQQERDEVARRWNQPEDQPDLLGRQPGDSLSPSRYSVSFLQKKKAEIKNNGIWTAEYQQAPTPPEGNRIKRDWFEFVSDFPHEGAKLIRYWDKAGTQNGGKFSAGVLMAEATDDFYYVVDVKRGQLSSRRREQLIKDTAAEDRRRYGLRVKTVVEQEPGSGGKESAENTVRNLAGYRVGKDRPSGDKDTRLEPFEDQAEAGNVKLVRGPWNTPYLDELVQIPNGEFRDQGDATAGAFNLLTGRGRPAKRRRHKGLYDS